jgi:hypothetical protein
MPAVTQQIEREKPAAYERWIQAELSGDSRLTSTRILYNDIRDYGVVRPETWAYFDLQEMTGGAETMDTQHITELEGTYDPATDEIVAAVAGGERVTYDSFTVSGVRRAEERAAQNPNFSFQVTRDQIYHDNYHGPVKEMWRSQTDYDTVIYMSTFPEDVIDALGDRGRMLLQDLAYDLDGKKGFIYGYRKGPKGKMEGFAARIGNATPEFCAAYLQKRGFAAEDFEGVNSHQYGAFVITANTAGQTIKEVAQQEAGWFDVAATELTGKSHHFGRDQEGIDAYELFKQTPNLWKAYRQYHRLLAEHFAQLPLHDDLYDYLVATHDAVGFHVLKPHEEDRLAKQLAAKKITADMALACKKIMTYSHYAKINQILDEYRRTGQFVDIDGDDIMQAYGAAAGESGGQAAQAGEVFNDCESVYGETSSSAVVEMAARLGISIEEALRRLKKKPEVWSAGDCRNCERKTLIWKEPDGGCNVCRKCSQEHTLWGQTGLDRERRRAQAEREKDQRLPALDAEMEAYMAKATEEDDAPIGTTRYVDGQQHMLVQVITVGGAHAVWIDTATGKTVDDAQA